MKRKIISASVFIGVELLVLGFAYTAWLFRPFPEHSIINLAGVGLVIIAGTATNFWGYKKILNAISSG